MMTTGMDCVIKVLMQDQGVYKTKTSAHIKSAISNTRRGIGLLKYLSKYLPRHPLNELYKLYVRSHLDYGDVMYHIPAKVCEFSQNIVLPN